MDCKVDNQKVDKNEQSISGPVSGCNASDLCNVLIGDIEKLLFYFTCSILDTSLHQREYSYHSLNVVGNILL